MAIHKDYSRIEHFYLLFYYFQTDVFFFLGQVFPRRSDSWGCLTGYPKREESQTQQARAITASGKGRQLNV